MSACPMGHGLPQSREVSSIPRGGLDSKENEKWVYPSEEMFYEAMKRKNHNPNRNDMKVIVPIHNAVNEKVWSEIQKWESETSTCEPKLVKFEAKQNQLTPKAMFRWFLGYKKPFDRHDWTIDRCGEQITYVIDFYSGENLSFYLDVRPKISMEGIKMRVRRFIKF